MGLYLFPNFTVKPTELAVGNALSFHTPSSYLALVATAAPIAAAPIRAASIAAVCVSSPAQVGAPTAEDSDTDADPRDTFVLSLGKKRQRRKK